MKDKQTANNDIPCSNKDCDKMSTHKVAIVSEHGDGCQLYKEAIGYEYYCESCAKGARYAK